MLAAFLLAGLVAAPIATAALFTTSPRRGRTTGVWPATRRVTLSVVATLALGAIVGGILVLLGATRTNTVAGVAGLLAVSALWLPVTRHWSARAHVAWSATTYLFLAYLAYMLWWTFVSHLGIAGTIGALVLWLMEAFAAFLGVAYLWELCDALGRETWTRRVQDGAAGTVPDERLPFVSLQVPAYNEPPEMVIETLQSLAAIDYPAYEVIVIDDNTDDEGLWRPVEAWCLGHGMKFAHLSDWPGYKSGALNFALREMVDPRTELIGVIDADYQLDPGFLRACAPLFADESVGFIQAPQDYRDWEQAPFYRRLYYSYKYFFAVSQPSRNERDGAIFAGTMGLIRKRALDQAGGWDEWCITEDAELSLRLLRDGWSGLHVDRSFGEGVMPLTFEALKGQRFRWCFGGIQILRRHWRLMMPGRASKANRMDQGQRWAYLSGAVQWYGDLLAVMFFLFLLLGAGNVALGGGLLFRKLSGFLLAAIPLLAVLGLARAVALLRRGTGASWRDALGAFMIWQSTSIVVARASVQGLFAKEAEFLQDAQDGRGRALVGRRPRQPAGVALRRARARRHRRLPRGREHGRSHHRRTARLADRRVRLRAPQQPGRPTRGSSRRAQRAPAYGVPTLRCPTRDHHRSRADGRSGHRRRGRRPARPSRQASGLAQPTRPGPWAPAVAGGAERRSVEQPEPVDVVGSDHVVDGDECDDCAHLVGPDHDGADDGADQRHTDDGADQRHTDDCSDLCHALSVSRCARARHRRGRGRRGGSGSPSRSRSAGTPVGRGRAPACVGAGRGRAGGSWSRCRSPGPTPRGAGAAW